LKKPITTQWLREQFFGEGEGGAWDTGKYADPSILTQRDKSFEGGETLNDVGRRVSKFIEAVVKPWLLLSADRDIHLVCTSHGICITEFTSALCQLDPYCPNDFLGPLNNTSYHQIALTLPSSFKVTESVREAAKQVTESGTVPEEPFMPELEVKPKVEIKRSRVEDHLKGLTRHTAHVKSEEEKKQQAQKEKFFAGGGANKGNEGEAGDGLGKL